MERPEHIEWRDSKLCAITGWFLQPSLIDGKTAFGGYFRYDVKDRLVLDGQLIDLWGPSKISGIMDDRQFVFTKKYDGRVEPIEYRFTKQNGIWVGEYKGKATGQGQAECRTFTVHEDAFNIVCGTIRRT